MKILLIIIDGLGDEPIPEFEGKTPLEMAETPNLDFLARNGICGQILPKFQGAVPTSEETHFSLFSYDPEFYKIRRGIITATGAGMEAKRGDVALRGNLATVDEELNIIDRRAGRIENPKPFIKTLQGIEINGVKFLIKSATEHRLGIIMRGKNLDPNVSDGDPHYGKLGKKAREIKPLKESEKAVFTARVLNEFLEKAHQILRKHPENEKRKKEGLPEVNYVLVRGASSLRKLPSFKEKYGLKACCIAGKFLYQQIGRLLGMDLIKVKGATGKPDTNLKGKIEAAKRALKNFDFIFLHIKATDSLAEDGDFEAKKNFIEKIDKNIEFLLNNLNRLNYISQAPSSSKSYLDGLVVVTCDHSTCSLLKRHCKRPCPILIYGDGRDEVFEFSERACKKGKLGKIKQINLMEKILKLARG